MGRWKFGLGYDLREEMCGFLSVIFGVEGGIVTFLYYTTGRNDKILLLSLGNDHIYRATNYSWDAYIHA